GRTVLELFEVRRMLEPEAAAVAAQRADGETIAGLRRELDRMIAAGDRANELVDADAAFHDVIAAAPGNSVLRALLRSLSTRTAPAPHRSAASTRRSTTRRRSRSSTAPGTSASATSTPRPTTARASRSAGSARGCADDRATSSWSRRRSAACSDPMLPAGKAP